MIDTRKVEDLTDEALANVNRWHAIAHPAKAVEGVYEPARNPDGCTAPFCVNVLPEAAAYCAPAWFEAGRQQADALLAQTRDALQVAIGYADGTLDDVPGVLRRMELDGCREALRQAMEATT